MSSETIIKLIADGAVVPVVLIGAYALLFKIPRSRRYDSYVYVLLAGLTSYLIAKLLATVYQPQLQRPFELLGVDPGASFLANPGFPSDHALFVTVITLAVWFTTRSKPLTGILIVLTFLICAGRVLALVHTPLDVIGGVVVACIGAVWYLQMPRWHYDPVLQNTQKQHTL